MSIIECDLIMTFPGGDPAELGRVTPSRRHGRTRPAASNDSSFWVVSVLGQGSRAYIQA